MKTFDEFEALWKAARPLARTGTVTLIVARGAEDSREILEQGDLTVEEGLRGDRWARGRRDPGNQVTLMESRVAELVCDGRHTLDTPGDNLLVDLDLSNAQVPVGTRLRVGTALLEVTPIPHTGCRKFAERFGADALRWVNHREFRDRHLRGVNCRVVESGRVAPGDRIEVVTQVSE